jgi:hypothetical protein
MVGMVSVPFFSLAGATAREREVDFCTWPGVWGNASGKMGKTAEVDIASDMRGACDSWRKPDIAEGDSAGIIIVSRSSTDPAA